MSEIADKVQELRNLFQARFGVEADVQISIHDTSKELANYITNEVASQMDKDDIKQYKNTSREEFKWVTLRTNHFNLAAFYEDGHVLTSHDR
ncbi:MAG TPA: hypothetical protein DEF34_03165 [Desulfotomaculum sp.]|nr:MAG: hypothetical protein JL56_02785 [Desulfotomaculum sp. BICA1-6]HBX22627.1 hypothetical protein [Desulfotomaculum sp.]